MLKYENLHPYLTRDVELEDFDIETATAVMELVKLANPLSIVEIGFRQGSSTLAFLLTNNQCHVYSLDTRSAPNTQASVKFLNGTFPNRLTYFGGESVNLISALPINLADFVFISEGEEYSAVKRDADIAMKLKPTHLLFGGYNNESASRVVSELGFPVVRTSSLGNGFALVQLPNMLHTGLISTMMKTADARLLSHNKFIYTSLVELKNRFITDLSGDIVECGVWRGLTTTFLAILFPNNIVWACDSFEGCPHDGSQMEYHTRLEKDLGSHRGSYAEPKEKLLGNLDMYGVDRSRVNILKGWFKDTLNPATCPIQKISLLRIDGDMYSSTMEVLVDLYPKVVPGGAIVFDDWCLADSRAAAMDFLNALPKFPQLYEPVTCTPVGPQTADANDGRYQGLFFIKEADA